MPVITCSAREMLRHHGVSKTSIDESNSGRNTGQGSWHAALVMTPPEVVNIANNILRKTSPLGILSKRKRIPNTWQGNSLSDIQIDNQIRQTGHKQALHWVVCLDVLHRAAYFTSPYPSYTISERPVIPIFIKWPQYTSVIAWQALPVACTKVKPLKSFSHSPLMFRHSRTQKMPCDPGGHRRVGGSQYNNKP